MLLLLMMMMMMMMMMFCSYDSDRDKFLGVEDLKRMMKKLKSSAVELSAVEDMIKEVDEDGDEKLSLREVTTWTAEASTGFRGPGGPGPRLPPTYGGYGLPPNSFNYIFR